VIRLRFLRATSALALAMLLASGVGARGLAAPMIPTVMATSATAKSATASPSGEQRKIVGSRRRPSTSTPPARAQVVRQSVEKLAGEALTYEDRGGYLHAARILAELRRRVPADADLDLAIALDLARFGAADSAATLLWGPVLSAAIDDSLPVSRRHDIQGGRDAMWLDGKFTGWNWYIVRARAEVAATLGRWNDALAAARLAVAARPLAGKEWLILAVCAGRAGSPMEAAAAAERARFLDPTLPEAHYLNGLYQWKSGRRSVAQTEFRAAIGLDSTYRAPALALVRVRLPSARPDSLPSELLTGVRETGLVTSPMRPKLEEFLQADTPGALVDEQDPVLPDSVRAAITATDMALPIFLDERGRIVLHEMPWFEPSRMPEAAVSLWIGSLPRWRFEPAMKNGVPLRVWTTVQIHFAR
jgi:tetratricopeptide (TPR) repeat protein